MPPPAREGGGSRPGGRFLSPVRGIRLAIGVAGLALAGFGLICQIVPWGASPLPYLLASVYKGRYSSPGGSSTITVYYNDAGAAHSGAHWTWFVVQRWPIGRVVILEGWSDTEIIDGPLDLEWTGEREFRVDLGAGPRSVRLDP